ncbi:subtilisin family serine protease [Crossiella equi]|uniref:Subtilisin family serine protease n=1 Tax=Crossiella equi TaxID=130796 RepID=A0ABS5AEB6_9PSEU|nr:S8 family serine peptidase [Crossiella equi]MBP2474935.1 subtilisin family serine protease [Crossiella equi]
MTNPARRRLRPAAAVLAAAVGTAAFGLAAPASAAPQQNPPQADKQLDKRDRELLAEAEREGRPNVTLLVAAEKGGTDKAVSELRSLGGVVESTEKSVDYVKVSVPRDKAEQAAKLKSVNAIDVDAVIPVDDPTPQPNGAQQPLPQKAPDAKTPRVNPYMPTGDIGAAQFGQTLPFWDGRGTTIAVIDSGVDLDHPALATTSTGERKIVDWYTANSPTSGDGTWVAMTKTGRTGTFTEGGKQWTAPSTGGPYSFGLFRETAQDLGGVDSDIAGDVNRDGDRTDTWGVLQDIVTKEVRVDLNGDGDFTNDKSMIDYKVKQDVQFFGTDKAETKNVVERMAFVVQTDRSIYDTGGTPYVNLGISSGSHGSHVAGIAAGHKLLGGNIAGGAPGAKLISIKACLSTPGCTSSGLLDGVLYAAKNGADVVNISIGGLPGLNDGNNARAALYNRTIAEYKMQIFISAGNSGAGANTVGDPSVASDVVSVGSSITAETWLSNYGSVAAAKEGLHPFSSRGPAENGGFKPNIVAPGSAISSTLQWEPPGPTAGTYELPAGYSMYNGTSMASPQATGAAALLLSAYKATHGGQRPTPAQLRTAIYSSAKFLPGLGAYEQGAGKFDVWGAFFALQRGGTTDTVTTEVAVNTSLSAQLAKPGIGVGIHDREGVQVGKAYTRTYTLTRTSGAQGKARYQVDLVGNDGTFSAPRSVELPLNTPVKFDVKVNPKSAGVHSALLRLDNPWTPGIDHQGLATVFAPQEFTAAGGFKVTGKGEIGRNQAKSFFVKVPQGASALKIDLAAGGEAGKGQVRFLRFDPTGVPRDTTSTTNCYNPDGGAGCAGGTPTSRTIANPLPGVWEIVIEARRTSDVKVAPFAFSAEVLGTALTPNPDVIESAALGSVLDRSYKVDNTLAGFTGKVVGGTLASARVERPTIANQASQAYEVTVPAGATSFTATIGKTADAAADLDLLVQNCTSGTCVTAGSSADGDSEESVTVPNPAAGKWRVVVDGYSVPAGSTAYDYVDSFTSAGLGSLQVTDADAVRAPGSSWTVPAKITVAADPGAGRQLRGDLLVQTSAKVTLGQGSVRIQKVTT